MIVRYSSAVCCANLYQSCACASDNIREPERPAYFDELAARYYHIHIPCNRIERQQHGSGIVVDHKGVFRAGQLDNQLCYVILTGPALSGLYIYFQCGMPARYGFDSTSGGVRERSAAKSCVNYNAGRVDCPCKGHLRDPAKLSTNDICNRVSIRSALPSRYRFACAGKGFSHVIHNNFARMLRYQFFDAARSDKLVHRWQFSEFCIVFHGRIIGALSTKDK